MLSVFHYASRKSRWVPSHLVLTSQIPELLSAAVRCQSSLPLMDSISYFFSTWNHVCIFISISSPTHERRIIPVSTVLPALMAWIYPGTAWFHHQLIPSTYPPPKSLDPRSTMLVSQLGNCLFSSCRPKAGAVLNLSPFRLFSFGSCIVACVPRCKGRFKE